MALEWPLAALVLLSALLHASWNAVTKSSSDPLLNIAIVTSAGGLVAGVAIPFLPTPEPTAWPFLAGSAALHFLYMIALVRSYGLGDLSQVYPIARGLAPLGVAVLAVVAASEVPSPIRAVGLLLASAAILSLASVRRSPSPARMATFAAVVTAALISAYTVVDGLGVRRVAQPASYIAWMFFLDSFPILGVALWLRRGRISHFLRTEGLHAVGGGLMAVTGYGVVLWALSRGAMAPIAALRETSVVFAAVIGARLLGEPFGTHRLAASCTLAFGLILVQA